jgi:hypothetical protein
MREVKENYRVLSDSIWGHKTNTMKELGAGLQVLGAKQDALSRSMRTELGFVHVK